MGIGKLVIRCVWDAKTLGSSPGTRTWKLDKSSQTIYHSNMDKWCSRGKHNVDQTLFNKRAKAKDGLSAWCKPCMADYERVRYQNGDRERKTRNRKNTQQRARDYIWSVLTSSKCVDCENDDPLVLEFDHKDDSGKEYDIAEMHCLSVTRIKKEIEKCDVRCANCHKKRTSLQFGFWRSLR